MINLDSLDKAFKNAEEKERIPSNEEFVQHLFFDKGISLNEFVSLPLPYILSMIMTTMHINKENDKEMEKTK